jgi:hypothetical protein
MNIDTSPSRVDEGRRTREKSQDSVGLMLGLAGGAVGVFFLILGALVLGFFAIGLILYLSSIFLHR